MSRSPKVAPSAPENEAKHARRASGTVQQQAVLLQTADSPWFAAKSGNLDAIMKLFPGENVFAKGPVGENVFHVAMLANTPGSLAIVRYLVRLYGAELVRTPYQVRQRKHDPPGPYEGETALHIATVNKDPDMVKFLVQSGADVHARAFGRFFQPGQPCYYGEFPLSFAASLGQTETARYLKRHGAHISAADSNGNTALHMCVYHNQLEMFEFLLSYMGSDEDIRNNDGRTPLALAADLGRVDMFQRIYARKRKLLWSYGPVAAYYVPLADVDSVSTEPTSSMSIVETVVSNRNIRLLRDDILSIILTHKWRNYGAAALAVATAATALLAALLTAVVAARGSSRWTDRSRAPLEAVTFAVAVAYLLLLLWDYAAWLSATVQRARAWGHRGADVPGCFPIPGENIPEEERGRLFSGLTATIKRMSLDGKQGRKSLDKNMMNTPGAGGGTQALTQAREAHDARVTAVAASSFFGSTGSGGQGKRSLETVVRAGNERPGAAAVGRPSGGHSASFSTPMSSTHAGGAPPVPPPLSARVPSVRVTGAAGLPVPSVPSRGRLMGHDPENDAATRSRRPVMANRTRLSRAVDHVSGTGTPGSRPATNADDNLSGSVPVLAPPVLPRLSTQRSYRGLSPVEVPNEPTSADAEGGTRGRLNGAASFDLAGTSAPDRALHTQARVGGMSTNRTRKSRETPDLISPRKSTSMNARQGGDASPGAYDGDEGEAGRVLQEAMAHDAPLGVRAVLAPVWRAHVRAMRGRDMARDALWVACLLMEVAHFGLWLARRHPAYALGATAAFWDDALVGVAALLSWVALIDCLRPLSPLVSGAAWALELAWPRIAAFAGTYAALNVAFSVAFFALHAGARSALDPSAFAGGAAASPKALSSIQETMATMLNVLLLDSNYDVLVRDLPPPSEAVAVVLYIAYAVAVIAALGGMLLASLVNLWASAWPGALADLSLLSRARHLLRAERRLVGPLRSFTTLGDPFFDPRMDKKVYWLMYEGVDDKWLQDVGDVAKPTLPVSKVESAED